MLQERYHQRVVRSPREVRHALAYVMPDAPAVAVPRTWLLRVGWRRHGLIDLSEIPGPRRRQFG